MATEAQTAFFSYSRDDSKFALRLAEDLKAAGASVWLDKLELEHGKPWDIAIQRALTNCPLVLVILSPASVDSTNVLDEVSFALKKRKTVIPVLYRDCEIPFRLDRLHHVDFRADYARGLKGLLKTLGVQQQAVATSATVPGAAAPPGGAPDVSDEENVLAELKRRAEAGNASAMVELANAFIEGDGTHRDISRALAWYRRAAAAGNTTGMSKLALKYLFGQGVEKDERQAASWFRRAADLGDGFAMFNLAYMYEFGQGVEMDYGHAKSWYDKAAPSRPQDVRAAIERLTHKQAAEQSRLDQERKEREKAEADRLEQEERDRKAVEEFQLEEERNRAVAQARLEPEEAAKQALQENLRKRSAKRSPLGFFQLPTRAKIAAAALCGILIVALVFTWTILRFRSTQQTAEVHKQQAQGEVSNPQTTSATNGIAQKQQAQAATSNPQTTRGDTVLPKAEKSNLMARAPAQQMAPVTTSLVVPEGTKIAVRMGSTLDTKTAHAGDLFTGSLAYAVAVHGEAAIPASAWLTGTVVESRSPSKFKEQGVLVVTITTINVGGLPTTVETSNYTITVKGKSTQVGVGGGTGAEPLIGGIAGGGKGALIGALAGSKAGTGGAASADNKELRIPAESVITFELTRPITVSGHAKAAREQLPQQ